MYEGIDSSKDATACVPNIQFKDSHSTMGQSVGSHYFSYETLDESLNVPRHQCPQLQNRDSGISIP